MAATSSFTVPLLLPRNGSDGADSPSSSGAPQAALAMLIGRASGRRGPSLLVRETAARELDQRRADWGYSRPVVAFDIFWNLAFVAVSVAMLILTVDERPNVPVRIWICVYALQCLVHVVLVWLEYRRRRDRSVRERRGEGSRSGVAEEDVAVRIESEEEEEEAELEFGSSERTSVTKNCESVNTMASFLWWMVGFYWIVAGGNELQQDAPQLYLLAAVFLAFDVLFALFCILLACLIGIALCCCLPCIIALLYSFIGQDGASESDLKNLPKYIFRSSLSEDTSSVGAGKMIPVESNSGFLTTERILLQEDAECCICLSSYENGTELHALPCNHHFHAMCIEKWLKMNATCPLCKYNILKGMEEV